MHAQTFSEKDATSSYSGKNKKSFDTDEFRARVEEKGVDFFDPSLVTVGDLIAGGAINDVYAGNLLIDDKPQRVAIKTRRNIANITRYVEDTAIQSALRHHPNVDQILGVTVMNGKPVMLLELGGQPLQAHLKAPENNEMDWGTKVWLCLDVLQGLQALHNAHTIHGRLSGQNILVYPNEDSSFTAKITGFEFGLPKRKRWNWADSKLKIPLTDKSVKNTWWYFQPPEEPFLTSDATVLGISEIAWDIYGYGLLVWLIACGGCTPLFELGIEGILETQCNDEKMHQYLTTHRELPDPIPAELRDIILGCVRAEPSERMTLTQARRLLEKWLSEEKKQTSSRMDFVDLLVQVRALGITVYDQEEVSFIGPLSNAGASMMVYKGWINDNGVRTEVALKEPKQKMSRGKAVSLVLDVIRQEMRIMSMLQDHPNIVHIYGLTFNDIKPILIVELGISNLDEYLNDMAEDDTPVDWPSKARLTFEIAEGLQAMHDAGIVHGDLKGDNILVFAGEKEGSVIAKISDFGYSITMRSMIAGGDSGSTFAFQAPECSSRDLKEWRRRPYKDIYSFGLLTWQIVRNGEPPYFQMDPNDILDAKLRDKEYTNLVNELGADVPIQFKELIKATTRFHPSDRISLAKVQDYLADLLNKDPLYVKSNRSYKDAKDAFESYIQETPSQNQPNKNIDIKNFSASLGLKKRLFNDYLRSAKEGNSDAQFHLAKCYATGFGTEKDSEKAVQWCLKAAYADHPEAQYHVGCCFEFGTDPFCPEDEILPADKDPSLNKSPYNLKVSSRVDSIGAAADWYKKAFEGGYKIAQPALERVQEMLKQ